MKTKRYQAFFFGLVMLVSGCAPTLATTQPVPSATQAPPTATSTPEPDCSAETTPDFADYAAWTKVNPRPIKGHEVFVNIHVDDLAKETYL